MNKQNFIDIAGGASASPISPVSSVSRAEPNEHVIEDFTIICDTREQLPYFYDMDFTPEMNFGATRGTLQTGDYSIQGYEDQVAIERKSLDDYLGSITHGRPRFFQEIGRLAQIPTAAVVVEANLSDVIEGNYARDVSPASALGTAMAIQVDYGIPVMFLQNRQIAQHWCLHFLVRFYRYASKKEGGRK